TPSSLRPPESLVDIPPARPHSPEIRRLEAAGAAVVPGAAHLESFWGGVSQGGAEQTLPAAAETGSDGKQQCAADERALHGRPSSSLSPSRTAIQSTPVVAAAIAIARSSAPNP